MYTVSSNSNCLTPKHTQLVSMGVLLLKKLGNVDMGDYRKFSFLQNLLGQISSPLQVIVKISQFSLLDTDNKTK